MLNAKSHTPRTLRTNIPFVTSKVRYYRSLCTKPEELSVVAISAEIDRAWWQN